MKHTLDQRKMQIAKAATTAASSKYNIGGTKKVCYHPKPITLPKLKCLEKTD